MHKSDVNLQRNGKWNQKKNANSHRNRAVLALITAVSIQSVDEDEMRNEIHINSVNTPHADIRALMNAHASERIPIECMR